MVLVIKVKHIKTVNKDLERGKKEYIVDGPSHEHGQTHGWEHSCVRKNEGKKDDKNNPIQSDKPKAPLFGLEPGWFNKLLDTTSAPPET